MTLINVIMIKTFLHGGIVLQIPGVPEDKSSLQTSPDSGVRQVGRARGERERDSEREGGTEGEGEMTQRREGGKKQGREVWWEVL